MSREEAVYYREIQKNAYLKRIVDDAGGKLKPLSYKRALPKAMWTVFCVHNGRSPYLEQYTEQDGPSTVAHKPLWRASLERARHVTASVRPWPGGGYDFLVATDLGPVRMLAPDWDTMQDWVTALRGKLHELQVLGKGENVYGAPPVAPPPRAGFRDPTSPLPPTPVGPAIRVPGIEPIIPISRTVQHEAVSSESPVDSTEMSDINETENASVQPDTASNGDEVEDASSDITEHSEVSHPLERLGWDQAIQLASSTANTVNTGAHTASSDKNKATAEKIAKICGQNICLDESILTRKRLQEVYTDHDFFAELDQINTEKSVGEYVEDDFEIGHGIHDLSEVETLTFDERIDGYKVEVPAFDQDTFEPTTSASCVLTATTQPVSATDTSLENAEVSRTQIVGGEFKQRLVISDEATARNERPQSSSNVTVIQVSPTRKPPHTAIPIVGTENVFDFEFEQKLQTQNTVEVIDSNDETMQGKCSKVRLEGSAEGFVNIVNTDDEMNVNSGEYAYGHVSMTTTVQLFSNHEGIYEKLCMASTSNEPTQNNESPLEDAQLTNSRKTSLPNLETLRDPNPIYEYLCPLSANEESRVTVSTFQSANGVLDIQNGGRTQSSCRRAPTENGRGRTLANVTNMHVNGPILSADGARVTALRNIERSHSQSSYDATSMLVREKARNILGRSQNHAPKREGGNSKDNDHADVKTSKGLFKRGLTELSFLSKLKTLGNKPTRDQQRPEPANTRQNCSPVKVVRRPRPDTRPGDAAVRRRSTSLSGPGERIGREGAAPLRVRQAAALRAEQSRGAAVAARLARADADADPPAFADAQGQVWVATWGRGGSWFGGRAGDRVAAIRGTRPTDAAHARTLLKQSTAYSTVDFLFHRVPHAKIYILYKEKDDENIGIKLDGECCISRVEAGSPAARAGLPPPGPRWAVTEINNRPVNLLKCGDEDVRRLSGRCEEVSVLLQPLPLVQRLRAALKSNRIKYT